jgi:membrane protease subunit (stomatin/prohibitin family)
MGFFSNKKDGGLLDIIRCDENEYLIWKWKPSNNENNSSRENSIRWGSSLRVKDSEVAVFVYKQHNGTMQDFLEGPFDQIIKTDNFPVISNIIGLAFAGKSPFQAEVYFINLSENVQVKFGVPYFDVFDPRFDDFGVPTAVRGSITFFIKDYKRFIKLNRLINFDLDAFKQQIKNSVIKFVKGIVTNIPNDLNISVLQLERKILEVNDFVFNRIKDSLEEDFGITIKRLDIAHIEFDKESEEYQKLKELTSGIEEKLVKTKAEISIETLKAEANAKIKDIEISAVKRQKQYPKLPVRIPCES